MGDVRAFEGPHFGLRLGLHFGAQGCDVQALRPPVRRVLAFLHQAALDILPPNLVGLLRGLEQRGWVEKREHPTDRRAQGLYVTPAGAEVQARAQADIAAVEHGPLTHLDADERTTLIRLLRKVYQGPQA